MKFVSCTSSLDILLPSLILGLVYTTVKAQTDPVFSTGLPTSYSILDSTGTGVSIADIIFTDADLDALLLTMVVDEYFQFVDNNDNTAGFNLEDVKNGTGWQSVKCTISTDATTSVLGVSGLTVTLDFIALDPTFRTATASYNITVTNEAPTLSGLPTSTQLSEDTYLQTLVYNITCTDPSDTVSASLVSVTPSNAPSQEFFFVQKIPSLSVYAVYSRSQADPSQGVFSYNTQRDFIIEVACTDNKDTVTGNLTVNLQQNQPPAITTPSAAAAQSVASTVVAGTIVYTLMATDNENNPVTFDVVSVPTNPPFRVLSSGAVQTTADMSTASSSTYVLTITPQDTKNTGSPVTLTLTISGSNTAPTFSNLNNTITVNENTATSTSVFQITAIDADGDSLTKYLLSSNPAVGTSLFELDGSDNINTIAALNYETLTAKVYELTIAATDGTETSTATLTVSLVDVNENLAWTASTYRADIAEGSAVGTTLTNLSLNTTDPDVNDAVSCSMACILSGYFSISSGCIVTVSTIYRLDSGLANTVVCNVSGTDSGGNTATTTLTIDIVDTNNYTPTFAPTTYRYSITGYEAINTTLGTVTATDSDAGTFGDFSYSLNQRLLPTTVFNINSTSGEITTAISIENCNCTGITWVIPVYATDLGGLVGTATAVITITATTTELTIVTTERPISFLEEPQNAAWFSIFMVAVIITAIVTGVILVTQVFNGSRNPFSNRYRGYGRYGNRNLPMDDYDVPARNHPPSKQNQQWRNEYRFY